MPAETYSMTGLRIRTPHRNDVLSGRGGGINSHPGNKVFRDWVAERKEDYNLAPNKMEKTRVATEVMERVKAQNPPGRFLARDPTSGSSTIQWWVEIDEARALSKTSQALREGAPQIRLAHKEELLQRATKAKRTAAKRKRKPSTSSSATTGAVARPHPSATTTSTAPGIPPFKPLKRLPTDDYNRAMENLQANVRDAKDFADQQERHNSTQQEDEQADRAVPIIAPLTSNKNFHQQYWDPHTKRLRLDHTPHVSPGTNNQDVQLLDAFSETPPLLSLPTPPNVDHNLEDFHLDAPHLNNNNSNNNNNHKRRDAFFQAINSPAPSAKSLPRVHSLALSDFSISDTNGVFDDDGEFVNPFEDESGIAGKVMKSRQVSSTNDHNNQNQNNNSEYLRNLSSNEEFNPEMSSELHHVEPHHQDSHRDNHQHSPSWEDVHHSGSFPSLVPDENYYYGDNEDNHHYHQQQQSVFHGSWETDFEEAMKSILDVVHPDLTSPEKGERLPTLLMPFRGSKSMGGEAGILSNSSNGNKNKNNNGRRSNVSPRVANGKQ